MTTKLNPFAAAPQPMKSGRSTSMDIAASLEPNLIELVNIRASQINGCANLYLVMLPIYTSIVRLLAIAFYFFLATRVAAARGKFGVNSRQQLAIPISSALFART